MKSHNYKDYQQNQENQQLYSKDTKIEHKMQKNFSSIIAEKKNKYVEKKFCEARNLQNCNRVQKLDQKSNKKSNQQKAFNKQKFYESNSFNDSLKNKQNSLRSLSKEFKAKIFYPTNDFSTKKKPINTKKNRPHSTCSKTQQKYFKTEPAINENLMLSRYRDSILSIKRMQKHIKSIEKQHSTSKKKGIQCTLYERSIQKKINQSSIKSAKKFITLKQGYEKTQKQMGVDDKCPTKEVKKILLRKKNIEDRKNIHANQYQYLNNTNCFNQIALDLAKQARSKSRQRNRTQLSTSLTKPRLSDPRLSSFSFRSVHKNISVIDFQTSHHRPKSSLMMLKIDETIQKVRSHYKFVLNYLSEQQIINKLKGYYLKGEQSCKWSLMLIDEVYQMIKHSEQTRLKGMQYSRIQYMLELDGK